MEEINLESFNEFLKERDIELEDFIDEHDSELAEMLETGSAVIELEGRRFAFKIDEDARKILEGIVESDSQYNDIVHDYADSFCELIETGEATFELDCETEEDEDGDADMLVLLSITLEVSHAD